MKKISLVLISILSLIIFTGCEEKVIYTYDKITVNDNVYEEDGKYVYDATYTNTSDEAVKVKKVQTMFYDENDNPIFLIDSINDTVIEAHESKNIRFIEPTLKDSVRIEKEIFYADNYED